MRARDEQLPSPIRLTDYRPPAWRVEAVELAFDLGIDASEVDARLTLRRGPAQAAPLRLHGEGLELLAISLDGQPLPERAWREQGGFLEVDGAQDGSVLETRVRLNPAANTALEGLYLSGPRESGFLLTQCEAEGFRHITYFPDRPDVLARFTVTLRADRERFPVLLAGGNPDGSGTLPDGRHWARFVDPYPKPSYLFALVAGRLQSIERDYTTAEGRAVRLVIWAEPEVIGRCHYAMDALERAMRWDEEAYGRSYDLDVFHVVATQDFNMGAMENKGLNIFNAKYLLADPDTTTDDEYRAVEAVVAHEYFHNWSGNRVTCRDWFQLSLKEGFTVYREQQFSAAMNSPALKRIDDVALLRRAQFPEDAGPLAHPVRPAQYSEINNFYTATVYEKGSELVRMLAGRLGAEGFRRGTDLYFARHDGCAATLEDFLQALGEANELDLMPYLAWYAQAGTPRISAAGRHDPQRNEYALTLRQHTPASPGQAEKRPLPVPVRMALFGHDGRMLALPGGEGPDATERVLELDAEESTFVFQGIAEPPVPSLMRGFSAPVIVDYPYTPADLALLLTHDTDGFNRWEAGQQLALQACDALRDGRGEAALASWTSTLASLFETTGMDPALLAALLTPPGEIELAERDEVVDPAAIHERRERLQRHLAERIGVPVLERRYRDLAAESTRALDGASQARRRLKRRVLELLAVIAPTTAHALAADQLAQALQMTDRLAALSVLVRGRAAQAPAALSAFRERHAGDPLALDKWFTAQAQLPGEGALVQVQALESDPAFTLKNPNRVNALLGAFARGNPSGFHRDDGAGYAWLAQRLATLDALNPQVAARLATAFNGWQRLEPGRRARAHAALEGLAEKTLSPNLDEIVGNMLKAAA